MKCVEMKGKNSRNIEEIIKEYRIELLHGAELMHKLILDFIKNKLNKKELDGVIKSEKKCDHLKDEYIQVLFQNKRALPFLVEDRYKIITLVDQVLGKVEYLARFIKIYPFDLYKDISEDFKKMCDICQQMITGLLETLELIETNFTAAYDKTFEIEAIRRPARKMKFELLGNIYKKKDEPTRIHLTSDLINNLYNIIGLIEDIADYLRGLIIKYPTR